MFVVGLPRSGTTLVEQVLAAIQRSLRRRRDPAGRSTPWTPSAATSPTPSRPLHRLDRETAGRARPRTWKSSAPSPTAPPHRRQDAGQLPASGAAGLPLPAGEVHPLPPRPPRRGRFLLDDAFQGSPLGQRPAAHCRAVSRLPADHGALAEGPARAAAWKSTTRKRWPIWKAWPAGSWPGAAWSGSRAAWISTGRSGPSARPAPSRSASRSTRPPWHDGGTTSSRWPRCWRGLLTPTRAAARLTGNPARRFSIRPWRRDPGPARASTIGLRRSERCSGIRA